MAISKAADKAHAQEALSELEVRQRLDELTSEIASLSRTLADLGGQKVEDYRDELERLVADAVSASRKAMDSARTGAASLEQGFEEQVREHPLRAIGIAAGIGFLFAFLTRR
ncbi:MAG: DUF883 family protein [Rhizobiaceae bacterium]|nr:DUF883 family protein [Rhizobiaceae bacterium]